MQQTLSPRDLIRRQAHPILHQRDDYDDLLRLIGDARIVLLGDATHGTQEFYDERARITKRLILEEGFTGIAMPAGAAEVFRLNRYIHGVGPGETSLDAFAGFAHFPRWVWRNTAVQDFLFWLRAFNMTEAVPAHQVSIYGLDPYSFEATASALINFLEREDATSADRARRYFAQFERFGTQPDGSAPPLVLALSRPLQDVLSAYLTALHQYRAGQMYAQYDGRLADDETFVTEIEHHAGAHARDYYRLMLSGHEIAWNLREQEMVRTLAHLAAHLRGRSPHARIVIWGHNAHIGDLRATERSRQGERSLGELARARYGDNAVLIGFDTHHGTLTAAADWGVTPRTLPMPPALPASYEALFHEADLPGFWLRLRDNPRVRTLAAAPHLERAVGAVFAADSARDDRYLTARLAAQFDALVFLDETHAVVPLES